MARCGSLPPGVFRAGGLYDIFLLYYKCKDSLFDPLSRPYCEPWPFWGSLPAQKGLEEPLGRDGA